MLTELVVAAERHHGRRVVVSFHFDPSAPVPERWAVWIAHAADQVWLAGSLPAAMAEATKTLRVP